MRKYAYYHKTDISNTIRQKFNFALKYIYFLINHLPMTYMYVNFIISSPGSIITHWLRGIYKGTLGNCADPDQMGHNKVSDRGLHCYLRNFYL